MSGWGEKLGFEQNKAKQATNQSRFTRPYINTPYSNYIAQTNTLTLDPSIRSLQEEALGRSRGMLGNLSQGFNDYQTNTMGIRNQLVSSQSPYITARTNPVREAGAQRLGALQSDIGLRQIGGSSFANQALSNLDFDTARQIGDASAIANAENLAAITGLDKDMLNALIGKIQVEANINGWTTEVAQQRLNQELKSMGMGEYQSDDKTTYAKDQKVYDEVSYGMSSANPPTNGGFCYVAEVLYGIDFERTNKIRIFVGTHLDDVSILGSFLRLYKKYGKKWAILVKKNNLLFMMAKFIWDGLYSKSEKENARIR